MNEIREKTHQLWPNESKIIISKIRNLTTDFIAYFLFFGSVKISISRIDLIIKYFYGFKQIDPIDPFDFEFHVF